MKLTKQAILNLDSGLNAVGELGGAKFAYGVARNISNLKSEIEALQKAYAPKKDFLPYERKRATLATSNSVKVNGVPQKITENGIERFVIEDSPKFEAELKTLQKEYKQVVEERETQKKAFQEILKEEVEIELHTIPFECVPLAIKAKEMAGILLIVEAMVKSGSDSEVKIENKQVN